MSEAEPDAPLLGVVVSPTRIEAQQVERTPFGRLRAAGKRLLEDIERPLLSAAPAVEHRITGTDLTPAEERAADAWVQSTANIIAKLAFGARGGAVRVGLAIDARLDGPGRRVLAARGGPQVEDIVDALEGALHGRGISLFAPLASAISLVEAYALGEIWSPLGGLAGGIDGVLVMWDQDVGWADVARGEVLRRGSELPGSRLDLGLERLDQRRVERFGEGQPLAVSARRGDEDARGLFREAALVLGKGAARRLLAQLARDLDRAPGSGTQLSPLRIVLAGSCGRFAADPRLEGCVLAPFAEGLANGLRDREDAAMEAGLLERDGGGEARLTPGIIHVAQDVSAAVVGAAASALRDILPRDEPGPRSAEDRP